MDSTLQGVASNSLNPIRPVGKPAGLFWFVLSDFCQQFARITLVLLVSAAKIIGGSGNPRIVGALAC